MIHLSLLYGNGVFSLPESFLEYLDKADPLTLKLFLHLAADASLRAAFDPKAFAKSFAVTEKEVEASLSFWQNAGLLTRDDQEVPPKKSQSRVKVTKKTSDNGESVTVVSSDAMPTYTGSELERLMNETPALSTLIEECQAIAGKMFGIHEINLVIGMADVLRLDHGAILLLFGYAQSIGKCSVNYVVKIAQGLVNDGISQYAEVEASLIRRLGGLGGRALSAREGRFVDAWSAYEFSEDILTLAYEITVNNTAGFSFPYMNKILVNWHEAGYQTKAEIEEALNAYHQDKKNEASEGSFDIDDFFDAAMKRTKKLADNQSTT